MHDSVGVQRENPREFPDGFSLVRTRAGYQEKEDEDRNQMKHGSFLLNNLVDSFFYIEMTSSTGNKERAMAAAMRNEAVEQLVSLSGSWFLAEWRHDCRPAGLQCNEREI
ncbi:hypothetical protein V6N12_051883 [Hibiscus sabdariffa]|uniref:Leucine-rich repeat-containing N-terminal plant-type domain-containing protein n=1 Tax=Hibiscus sabdariffa TaxID=183260 RepID=A0ABR2GGL4_9ROSI